MAELKVNVNKVMKDVVLNVKVKVTGKKIFKIKLFFAIQLIKLAALFIGCGIEINTDITKIEKEIKI